ncbi:hypothetical protein ACSQ6I_04850 [Anabaena sp. WFMT]|uniref:hypothetical protein n=1 Tax=Anabaena sp. WFMT TaxID=3449730 RepID=UPI003F27FA66
MAKVLINPTDEQNKRLDVLEKSDLLHIPSDSNFCLLDKDGAVCTEQMQWWLPKNLDLLEKEDGRIYEEIIPLKEKYVLVNGQELVKINEIKVSYYVHSLSDEIIIHGKEVIEAVLKDFGTDEAEYFKRIDD